MVISSVLLPNHWAFQSLKNMVGKQLSACRLGQVQVDDYIFFWLSDVGLTSQHVCACKGGGGGGGGVITSLNSHCCHSE